MLSIFRSMFFLLFSLSLQEIKVPVALTGSAVHFSPKSLELLQLQGPNPIAFVFSTFSERPERSFDLNLLNSCWKSLKHEFVFSYLLNYQHLPCHLP